VAAPAADAGPVILTETRERIGIITLNRPGRRNALNAELLIRLHESGLAAPSYTTLGERYCLRVAIVNHRTRDADLEILVRAVVELGERLR